MGLGCVLFAITYFLLLYLSFAKPVYAYSECEEGSIKEISKIDLIGCNYSREFKLTMMIAVSSDQCRHRARKSKISK
jgi:hypothetical protein